MAEEEKGEEAAEEQEGAAPKKRSKLPLIVAVVVLLSAGGGGAAWYLGLLGGGAGAEADAAPLDPTKGMADPSVPGAMLALDPFIANLADPGGGRYLKTTFQLEFATDAIPPEAEVRMPQIRDLLLTLLTSRSYEEIRTPAGKQGLREDIINRVNQAIDDDTVRAVYFTEFIVQ
jgi:flagellar FliL protein